MVEPYNATLSIHQLLENSDETFMIDNEALFKISTRILKQKEPKYADLNWVIAMTMSGVTASLRFSGKLNGDLRKLAVNLVPFPRLHFFVLSHTPLFAPNEANKIDLNVPLIIDQMWTSKYFLSNIKAQDGKYLSAACLFRGANIATQAVDDGLARTQQKIQSGGQFVEWIPNNIKSSVIGVAPKQSPISGTFLANTTAIKGVFQRISAQFYRLYKRKAFLHWYKGEGMDELEFQEADNNVKDLITEYQDKQDVIIEADDDDDDDGGNEDEEED